MSKNIAVLEEWSFDWSDGFRAASLKAVLQRVQSKYNGAIEWYQVKRIWKRRGARACRIGAVVVGMLAAILPTVSEMWGAPLKWYVRPGMATILGIVAGTLIALDKLFGASSGWVRYVMAETTLKELRDELAMTYTLETGLWTGQLDPTVEQTKHALTVLQNSLARANQVVRDETNQWKTEFQSALQQTEELAKVQPRKVEEVVALVRIGNPDRLAGVWSLSVNGGPDEEGSSDSKSIRLTPGPVTVRVKAVIKTGPTEADKRDYSTEVADVLTVGTPKEFRITLPLN